MQGIPITKRALAVRIKKTKKLIFKAVDRKTRKIIAWVTGNREVAIFKNCTNKLNT